MKREHFLELTPVKYTGAGIKTARYKVGRDEKCFFPHWHDRMELIRVNDGTLYVEYDSERFKLSENTLMVIPPKKMHKGYTLENGADYSIAMLDVRSFCNGTDICKETTAQIFDGLAVFNNVTADEDVLNCFDSIFDGNKNPSMHTVALVYQMLSLLYERELRELRERPTDLFAKRVTEYVAENISKEISVSSLAELFGYTEAHFCRKFKAAMGISPMIYLKIHRLDTACKYIRSSDASISDIALICGFTDANYFSRCFKERYELSPMKYRKKNSEY